MGMRGNIFLLLLLLAFACIVSAQTKRKSAIANEAAAQKPFSTSETYSDTLRMLKAWLDTEEDDQLAPLFSVGDARTSDLLAACRSADDDIAGAAFLTLQLLGKLDCGSCPDLTWQKHTGFLLSCTANLTGADFQRIERWLAQRRNGTGYECGEEEEPLIDDALVYALILDGSPSSQSILNKMLALERTCKAADTITGETLEQAHELVALAKKIGHDLTLEPDIEKAVRASAFFLPAEYRNDSKVEVLSRTDNRVLLDVSYICGRLCGRGYYVVLRKEGQVWQYAVIRMAWIS